VKQHYVSEKKDKRQLILSFSVREPDDLSPCSNMMIWIQSWVISQYSQPISIYQYRRTSSSSLC